MSYLGLDIGTGGCKAVAFDAGGKKLAAAYREYPLRLPQKGWAELDPREVLAACRDVIRAVNGVLSADPVRAMSVSSLGESFVAVDDQGEPLCPAMTSSDARAREAMEKWCEQFDSKRIYRITGHTPYPIFTLYKLSWLKENQPEVWHNARRFLCFEDLFHLYAGIEPHISWSLAGRTLLFDVNRHEWSAEILSTLELGASRLAAPVPSGTITGIIRTDKGAEFGFTAPVMLVAGGHDQTCAALGAGVIREGSCMYATGSVECFCPVLKSPAFSDELRRSNLCCYDYTLSGLYASVAYSLTGGNMLRWVRDTFGEQECRIASEKGTNAYTELLALMPDEPSSLTVLPYLSATGTPYFDTRTPGAIVGLRLGTTKGEIIRALLEGVALEMKLNLQLMERSGMRIDTLIATGGGARNDRWTQLKADVLGKRIIVRDVDEAGCLGAAMLACSAHSGRPIVECVETAVTDRRTFEPDPAKTTVYDRKFEEYNHLYNALKKG